MATVEKKKRGFWRRMLLPAVIVLLLLIFMRIWLQFYIEHSLCAKLAEMLKVGYITCEVRSIGFSHLDIANVRIPEGKTPRFLTADSIRFDYSPVGLANLSIDRISVSGLRIVAGYEKGKFFLPGLDLEKFKAGAPEKKRGSDGGIPVNIRKFVIRNSEINFLLNGKAQRLPFEMSSVLRDVGAASEGRQEYGLDLMIYPRGEIVKINGGIAPDLKRMFMELAVKELNIARFQDITDSVSGLKVSAVASVTSGFDMPDGNAGLSVNLTNLDLQYKGVRITNSSDSSGRQVPFVMQVGKRGDTMPFTFNAFRMVSPFPLDFSMDEPGGEMKLTDEGMTVATEIKVKLDREQFNSSFKPGGLMLRESESMTMLIDAKVRNDFGWNFNLTGLHDRNEMIEIEGVDKSVVCKPEVISVGGEGDAKSASLNYVIRFSGTEFRKQNGAAIGVPVLEVAGGLRADMLPAPTLSGSSKITLEGISAGAAKCAKVEAVIPYRWPLETAAGPKARQMDQIMGSISTEPFVAGESTFGGFEAVLKQSGDFFWDVSGQFNTVFDTLKVMVDGGIGLKDPKGFCLDFFFEVQDASGRMVAELDKMNPSLEGMRLEGSIAAKGHVSYESGNMKTDAGIVLSDALLDIPSRKLSIEGIDVQLTLQDLATMKSLPKQTLKFKKLSSGNIQLDSGRINFQIEAPSKFFIERSSFSWCGGRVNAPAMRIVPGENVSFTLYCDRLNLAMFLKQLKIAESTGDGTVNGRIPLTIGKGKLRIRDGFLYSTPGVGGIISFSKSDIIQSAFQSQDGISGSAFAMDVLNNFKYDWAKVTMNSGDENLVMLLEISGVPADSFAFEASSGTFRRVEKDEGDIVRFQGIRYDIKFNLPFDGLLKMESDFGNLIKDGSGE